MRFWKNGLKIDLEKAHMHTIENSSFVRYLSAKKSIDDRALNRNVWQHLWTVLPPSDKKRPLRILELGGGIGTMAERMIDAHRFTHAHYTTVEIEAELTAASRQRMTDRTAGADFKLSWRSRNTACLQKENGRITLEFVQANIFDYFKNGDFNQKWDLGLAHAFMDLVNPADVLPQFCAAVKPGGFLYLTLNYDGETILMPTLDPHLDKHIIRLYHQSMDERTIDGRKSGDSMAGRHLFAHLKKVRAQILACGSSDWIVFAGSRGYAPDEAYFLHFIIHTIHLALKDQPSLNQSNFEDWIRQRHAQIETGELILIAKQLDFLAQVPA